MIVKTPRSQSPGVAEFFADVQVAPTATAQIKALSEAFAAGALASFEIDDGENYVNVPRAYVTACVRRSEYVLFRFRKAPERYFSVALEPA